VQLPPDLEPFIYPQPDATRPTDTQVRVGRYSPRDGSDVENRILFWQGER